MDIIQYFNMPGNMNQDSIAILTRQLKHAENALLELKRTTATFIVPGCNSEDEIVPMFDQTRKPELVELASQINNKITEIANLNTKIVRINNILTQNNVEVPTIEYLYREIGRMEHGISRLDQKVRNLQAELIRAGPKMTRREAHERDLAELQKVLADLKVRDEPEIQRLTNIAAEISQILNN